jgi:hypothetical protein
VPGAGGTVRRPHARGAGPQHHQVGRRRRQPPAGTGDPFVAAAG